MLFNRTTNKNPSYITTSPTSTKKIDYGIVQKKKDSKPNNTTLSSGSVVVLLLLGLFKIYSLKCVGEDNKKKTPKLFYCI